MMTACFPLIRLYFDRSLKMVISLHCLEVLAFDLQSLFAREIACLPLEVKKLQGSHIVIDIIITFYVNSD